jgi:hypothetical protein
MIPKIIHQIWIGEIRMPLQFKRWSKKIIKFNPDWEHKLWTNVHIPEIIEDMPQLAKDKFKKFISEKQWALASDIIRYHIVYKYGGIYMDTDFVMNPKGSLNMLPLEKDLILTNMHGLKPSRPFRCRLQMCVFLASKNNPFMKQLVDNIGNQKYTLTDAGGIPFEKYSCQYITTEYYLHLRQDYKGKLPLHYMNEDLTNLIPKNEIIIDNGYFFSKDAKIANHLYSLSHHPNNIKKYMKQ